MPCPHRGLIVEKTPIAYGFEWKVGVIQFRLVGGGGDWTYTLSANSAYTPMTMCLIVSVIILKHIGRCASETSKIKPGALK